MTRLLRTAATFGKIWILRTLPGKVKERNQYSKVNESIVILDDRIFYHCIAAIERLFDWCGWMRVGQVAKKDCEIKGWNNDQPSACVAVGGR